MFTPILQFDQVSYTYPTLKKPAIHQLSLTIAEGQKTVLLGHNGCGKSTFLYLADGLYKPKCGVISWKDQPLKYDSHSLNEWRQRIGLSFQDPEKQLVAGTVAEDISYGLCNLSLPNEIIEQKLNQVLHDFNLADLANRPLHHLSLGQKKRVALAGVMALEPKLLLLDEPTAYLDTRQVRHLVQELDRIQAEGTTILMATHNLNLAYSWADWVLVLHEGQLVLSGRTDEIFSDETIIEQLEMEQPMLLELWSSLPANLKASDPPKNISDWKKQFEQKEF